MSFMDEYMHDRSVEINRNSNCVHSRKISFIIDSDHQEKTKFRTSKHFSNCKTCQKKWEIAERNSDVLAMNIPSTYPRKSLKLEFKSELKDLMKELSFVDKKSFTYRFKQQEQFALEVLKDFRASLTSANMVKFYMVSVIIGVTLKIFI